MINFGVTCSLFASEIFLIISELFVESCSPGLVSFLQTCFFFQDSFESLPHLSVTFVEAFSSAEELFDTEFNLEMVKDIFEAILEYCFDLQIQVSKHNPFFHTITIVLYLRPDPDP